MRKLERLATLILISALTYAGGVGAQTSAGAGTVLLLPLIADITAGTKWVSTIFVQNPNPNPITVSVTYYFSDNQGTVGIQGTSLACTPLSVPANAAVTFDPATQCPLSTLPSPGNTNVFGSLVLADATSTYATNVFLAYSRVAKPSGESGAGNGFSVEGFPVGNFSSATSDVIGLQRSSETPVPNFLSNCFVAALNEQVDYSITLRQGETGALLGTYPQSGPPLTLAPYHNVRIFDVITAAGLPAGNYSNVRATFTNQDGSAMIGYCTVESTTAGSADFRLAKSTDARDVRQSRLACYGMDSCPASTPSTNNPAEITNASLKNIHYAIFDQPDFIKCDLVGDVSTTLPYLEITLRGPGDPITSPTFALPAPYNAAPYTAGGGGATGFYIYTGEKSTIASGSTTRWYIDVQVRSGATGYSLPLKYGIECSSGNGISIPWLGTTAAATP